MHIMPIPWHVSLADIHPAYSRASALRRLCISRRRPILPVGRGYPSREMVRPAVPRSGAKRCRRAVICEGRRLAVGLAYGGVGYAAVCAGDHAGTDPLRPR